MYAQVAIKPNPLLRNGAYGIVMRGVQKCTRGCSSLRGRNKLPLCCIKLDTATDPACGTGSLVRKLSNTLKTHIFWCSVSILRKLYSARERLAFPLNWV